MKNAFALLGKQRFEHAAAFFLLGGALKDALEVPLNSLKLFLFFYMDLIIIYLLNIFYNYFLGYINTTQ